MNRREFLENACISGLGIVVGASVLGSLEIPTLKARTRIAAGGVREIPLRIEDTPELKEIGGMYHLEIEDLEKDILVARVSETEFAAVNIKCTHKGCKVTYKGATGTSEEMKEEEGMPKKTDNKPMFFCPCHESKYTLEGVPFAGPAKKPLGNYEAIFKDGEVTIRIPLDEGGAPADSTKTVQDTTKH